MWSHPEVGEGRVGVLIYIFVGTQFNPCVLSIVFLFLFFYIKNEDLALISFTSSFYLSGNNFFVGLTFSVYIMTKQILLTSESHNESCMYNFWFSWNY